MNWEDYQRGRSIACAFKPREYKNGPRIRHDLAALIGKTFLLTALWPCDAKHPGEFALEPADTETANIMDRAHLSWLASGDVAPIPFKKLEDVIHVTTDFTYAPTSELCIPYVVGKKATQDDISMAHSEICNLFRHTSRIYDDRNSASYGPARGTLALPKSLSNGSFLTASECDYLYNNSLNAIRYYPGLGAYLSSAQIWHSGSPAKYHGLNVNDVFDNALNCATITMMIYNNVDLSDAKNGNLSNT